MRATRENTDLKEKNNYISRLLKGHIENIRNLEEQVSQQESKIHKREEEFRRADNERMKKFFNARFDDIPGAFNKKREDNFERDLQVIRGNREKTSD